jgi:hypothetical protein
MHAASSRVPSGPARSRALTPAGVHWRLDAAPRRVCGHR